MKVLLCFLWQWKSFKKEPLIDIQKFKENNGEGVLFEKIQNQFGKSFSFRCEACYVLIEALNTSRDV